MNRKIESIIRHEKLRRHFIETGVIREIAITGPAGKGLEITGTYSSYDEFIKKHPTGSSGETYLVDGQLYVWNDNLKKWESSILGPTGATGSTGPTGPTGASLEILGTYDSYDEFEKAHPTGKTGDLYMVNGELCVWDEEKGKWQNEGSLIEVTGPTGPTGSTGPIGSIGPTGKGLEISGAYDSYAEFIEKHSVGTPGQTYMVDGELYIWDNDLKQWSKGGSLQGPTGPTGAGLELKGSYDTLEELEKAHSTGNIGDSYVVNGELYTWDEDSNSWKSGGLLQGPTGKQGPAGPQGEIGVTGPTGPTGAGLEIKGSYDTLTDLEAAHSTGTVGDAYAVNGELYTWDEDTNSWKSGGSLQGPTGPTGKGLGILGTYDTVIELETLHPTGNVGDVYMAQGELYTWDEDSGSWKNTGAIENMTGATGPTGAQGIQGVTGPQGIQGVTGPTGSTERFNKSSINKNVILSSFSL